MGKRKRKHANHQAAADRGEAGYGAPGAMGTGYGPGTEGWNGTAGPGMGYAYPGMDGGLMHNLQGLMGSRHTEQFIVGALIGAAAVYVLGDEELRSKLVKAGVRLYSGIAGGIEEIKEQMADMKAEVAAEKRNAE